VIALIVLVLIVVLVAVGTRQAVGRPGGVPARGHGVRRFFQYVLLLGLLAVAASSGVVPSPRTGGWAGGSPPRTGCRSCACSPR
jgi:hypothetical protein